jgi:hypothetical protein
MVQIHLIYLALITDRIPILSWFNPSHIGTAPSVYFGEVFDLPRLRRSLGIPVLEWRDIKHPNESDTEVLGCWNTWESVQRSENKPRKSLMPQQLKLGLWSHLASVAFNNRHGQIYHILRLLGG